MVSQKRIVMNLTVSTVRLLDRIAELKAEVSAGTLTEEDVLQEIQKISDNVMDYVDIHIG